LHDHGRITMFERYLRCWIFKGMFSDELAVRVASRNGDAAFFVPRDLVKGTIDHEGKVRVRVYHQGQTAWAVLPDDMQTALPVDESQLLAA
jgi:hypothetical protein